MPLKRWLQSKLRYEQAERLRSVVCAGLFYSGLGWLLARGRPRGAVVLIYHSVGGAGVFADNVISAAAFDAHLQFLREHRHPVPLSRIVDSLAAGVAPDPEWVAITFDDGYRDFLSHALPTLERHRMPATLFVPTMILQGRELFFDEIDRLVQAFRGPELALQLPCGRVAYPTEDAEERRDASLRLALVLREMDPPRREAGLAAVRTACAAVAVPRTARYCTAEDLKALPDWVELGSHSVGHFCLSRLADADLQHELDESARSLESLCGRRVVTLAYPFGKPWSYDSRVAETARASGYRAALTTIPGPVLDGTDPYAIPRYPGSPGLSRLRLNLMGVAI